MELSRSEQPTGTIPTVWSEGWTGLPSNEMLSWVGWRNTDERRVAGGVVEKLPISVGGKPLVQCRGDVQGMQHRAWVISKHAEFIGRSGSVRSSIAL